MTKRQQAIRDQLEAFLADVREDVKRELDAAPVGQSMIVRLPQKFMVGQFLQPFTSLMIHVMKVPDGYQWREYNPLFHQRKGRTEPAWRKLAA